MELILQNPWWKNKTEIENDRHIIPWMNSRVKWIPKIREEIRWIDAVYTIRGPRQVGKTTLLKLMIKDLLKDASPERIFYWSCDLIKNETELYETVLEYGRWARKLSDERIYIFLDEISNIKNWQKAIKLLWDTGFLINATVILTGSHSMDIRASSEKLPGRRGDVNEPDKMLLPMTFSEFLRLTDPRLWDKCRDLGKAEMLIPELNDYLGIYLITGGFPKAIDEYLREKRIKYSTYRMYLDVVLGDLERWGKKSITTKEILTVVINSITTPLSWSTIKNKTSVDSHNTVFSYIETLSESFTLFYIFKFNENFLPIHKKNKKIYFCDPLLLHCLNAWCLGKEGFESTLDFLGDVENESKLVENLVAVSLFERYKSNERFGFWSNRREVDFVTGDGRWMEVKWKEKIRNSDIGTLKRVKGEKIILTKNEYRTEDDVRLIPVSLFLCRDGAV